MYPSARAHTHTSYLVRTYTVKDLRDKYFPEPDAFAYEYSKVCFDHESRVLTFSTASFYHTGLYHTGLDNAFMRTSY